MAKPFRVGTEVVLKETSQVLVGISLVTIAPGEVATVTGYTRFRGQVYVQLSFGRIHIEWATPLDAVKVLDDDDQKAARQVWALGCDVWLLTLIGTFDVADIIGRIRDLHHATPAYLRPQFQAWLTDGFLGTPWTGQGFGRSGARGGLADVREFWRRRGREVAALAATYSHQTEALRRRYHDEIEGIASDEIRAAAYSGFKVGQSA